MLQEREPVWCISVAEVLKESKKNEVFRMLFSKLSQNKHIHVQNICFKDKLGVFVGPIIKKKEQAVGLL